MRHEPLGPSSASAALVVALASALLVLAAPLGAEAQRRTAGTFEGALELHPSFGLSGGSTGVGFDLRGTYWLRQSRRAQRIGPDFVLGWVNFPIDASDSASVLRLMGGVRVAFPSQGVTPALYARAGLHSFSGPRFHRGWWGWGPSWGALGAEAGGALDFRIAQGVSLGGHMGLNLVTRGFAYLNLGGQLSVEF